MKKSIFALRPTLIGLALLLGPGAVFQATLRPQEESRPAQHAARGEIVDRPGVAARTPQRAPEEHSVRLERVTTAVPWPRGLVFRDGELVVLARGRHRRSGGCDPEIQDRAGSLFAVDPNITEPVGVTPSEAVRRNGRVFVDPSAPPFCLWDRSKEPSTDTRMDRPYCTLAFDEASQNFFICGYSGVDLPGARFRKNATDSIHRYDLRTERWYAVEMHDPTVVPPEQLDYVVSNAHYPHHDPTQHAAPHGWLNGPDGCTVAGRTLYAVGKDNHVLVQYDLGAVREDPDAGPPPSRLAFGDVVDVRIDGTVRPLQIMGHSALATRDGWLYIGFRTSSMVLRFPLRKDGDLVRPLVGELIAEFQPWDPETRKSANLIDLAFNGAGELFVSCATRGRVWKVGVPDPARVFDGDDSRPDRPTPNRPYVDLPALTDNAKARTGNIVFDPEDRLYLCSGNYDAGTVMAGVIYRAVPR